MSDGGKGDAKRPMEITREQFDTNWDAIFGKKEPKQISLVPMSIPQKLGGKTADDVWFDGLWPGDVWFDDVLSDD